jgi:predicted phage tail protein
LRKFLLTSGIVLVVIGAAMFVLGFYDNSKPTGGSANIGAGILAVLGESLVIIGVCAVVASVITALVVWLRKRTSADR